MIDMPFFMMDETWFYFDYDTRLYKLTDKAPTEAVDSYKKYYAVIENGDL